MKRYALLIIAVILAPVTALGSASTVTFGSGAQVTVAGVTLTVEEVSGNTAVVDTLVVNSGNIQVTMMNGSRIKVVSGDQRAFSHDAPALMTKSTTCGGGQSTLSLDSILGDTVTVTITPLDTTCSGSSVGGGSGSSGGGGGGGAPSAPAAPAAPAPEAATIAQLQARVKELMAILASLTGGNVPSTFATPGVPGSAASLTMTLRQGMDNEQITTLQQILAADPAIYPEGKVTGYFGPATRRAVIRFQAKHGISQTGQVGPLTRAKLLELNP